MIALTTDISRAGSAGEGSPARPRALLAEFVRELRDRPGATALAVIGAIAMALFVVKGGYVAQHADQHDVSRAFIYAGALAAAGTMAILVLRPWWGVLAWVVTMPLVNVARAQVVLGHVQFIPTTLLTLALAAGVVLAGAIPLPVRRATGDGAGRGALRGPTLALLAAGAVVILALLSSVAAPDAAANVTIALHGLIEPLLVAMLVIALRPSRAAVALLVVAMAVSVTGAAAFNLVRMATLAHTLAQLDAQRVQFARLTYFNVGLFGVMLTMALPLLGGIFLFRDSLPRPRLVGTLAAAAFAVDTLALLITLTKSAWISTFAALVLLVLLVTPTWRMRVGLTAAILVLSAVVVPWPAWLIRPVAPGAADAYLSVLTKLEGASRVNSWDPSTIYGEVSITERALATSAALRMTVDHPLLGVGPGRFQTAYATTYRDPNATRDLGSAHNMLPNIAAEYGLPVAFFVAAAFLAALWAVWRVFRDGRRWDRHLAAALLAALVGFLIVSATFGIDLYEPNRLMDSDVVFAALLIAASLSLRAAPARPAV